ncbi:hypothetical protein N7539_004713 [Penicillium diatomitis]|uniref:Zn(2)-C6 fungal-type domain-containing protein n=1 Tax=Penicillium diatomitis TaxID=2819901 RepID=A0A9X0BUJ5_9EURO|nr:uncharacterized protein N7539_004713 [Penicillium diatomitis]KAJ5484725.1 hypothetical protein N7539_004713 [Penicillium diatomitis]
MEASSADKKRNKLGYHRTSVACVHCRRRKIRCLVSADDAQGRCENCIRLRKECQFFPVDQQPPIEKKSRPSSGMDAGSAPSATTPMSLPSSPNSMNPESTEPYYSYNSMSMNVSTSEMAVFNPGAFAPTQMSSFTPDRHGPTEDFSRMTAMEGTPSWDDFTTMSDQQMLATGIAPGKSQMMGMTPQHWDSAAVPAAMSPNSPLSCASPMAGHVQPMNPGPAGYAMHPDGSVWTAPPPPSRAMSYPPQEPGATFSSHFQPPMGQDLKRRMTTPANPTASHATSGSSYSMQMPPGGVPYPNQAGEMDFVQWQQMNAMSGGMNAVPYPMYTGDMSQQQFIPHPMGHPGAPRTSGP